MCRLGDEYSSAPLPSAERMVKHWKLTLEVGSQLNCQFPWIPSSLRRTFLMVPYPPVVAFWEVQWEGRGRAGKFSSTGGKLSLDPAFGWRSPL